MTSEELLLGDPMLNSDDYGTNRLKEYFYFGSHVQSGILVIASTAEEYERWLSSKNCQVFLFSLFFPIIIIIFEKKKYS